MVGCIVSVIPRISGDRLKPLRDRSLGNSENERTGGHLSAAGKSRLTGRQWDNHFTARYTLSCKSRYIADGCEGNPPRADRV
jgi:hypothetical protein